MPSVSEKQKFLRSLEQAALWAKISELHDEDSLEVADSDSSSSSSSDSSDEDVFEEEEDTSITLLKLKVCFDDVRYLSSRDPVRKSRDFIDNHLFFYDDMRFRQELRMNPESFWKILERIKEKSVFGNNAYCKQASPTRQLAVALNRFGASGNGASVDKTARKFGISEGAVHLYTNRVIVALLDMEQQVVKWPEPGAERRGISKAILLESGFPNCLGFVDGTIIPLACKPSPDGEFYFTRKHNYGIATMIVSDHERRILHINCGYTGSTHDSRVFRNSRLGTSPARFFAGEEYLLADSGYACTNYVITPYKKPAGNLPENREFNYALSRVRVNVEICIGMLKGRFQSLRELRTKIKSAQDHARAVFWIKACCVLHNLLLDKEIDDKCDEDWIELEEDNEEEQDEFQVPNIFLGQPKRDYLKELVRIAPPRNESP